MTMPFVSCLCPTYMRPRLLAQSIKMFEKQDYPSDRRELIVFDDSPGKPLVDLLYGPQVRLQFFTQRFSSLPSKYNAMVEVSIGDILVVWEDDDQYMPWHITAHVDALIQGDFSKPSRVLSDYPGHIVEEIGHGRFHASMAFSRNLFGSVGGWPETDRADFDQQFITRLSTNCSSQVDPCQHFDPSYCFKWHTGHYHGQNTMKGPDDVGWYRAIPELISQQTMNT